MSATNDSSQVPIQQIADEVNLALTSQFVPAPSNP
jgi:hypothetical protein